MLVGIKLHIHLCVCSFCLFLQNNVFCQIIGTGSVLPDWRTSQPDPNLPHNSNVWYFLFAKFCSDIQIACRASKDFFYYFFYCFVYVIIHISCFSSFTLEHHSHSIQMSPTSQYYSLSHFCEMSWSEVSMDCDSDAVNWTDQRQKH